MFFSEQTKKIQRNSSYFSKMNQFAFLQGFHFQKVFSYIFNNKIKKMFSFSIHRFHFQVYKNFVPPPSALEFVNSHIKKNFASYDQKTKLTSDFLQNEIIMSSSSGREPNRNSNPIPLYNTNSGGVNISARKCSKILLTEDDMVEGGTTSTSANENNNNNNCENKSVILPRNESTCSPISKTAEGFSVFENLLNEVSATTTKTERKEQKNQNQTHRVVPPFPVFEGNAKDQWIDNNIGFCHLCQEPTGTSLNHVGDRDHACMCYFLYLYSLYPRTWSTREIVLHSLNKFPPLAHHCVSTPFSVDHLHTLDDVQRRLELESLLVHLSNPNSPHQVLTNVLQGHAPISLWVAGERIFKPNVSQLVSEMLPPMAAGIQTAVTQKIWSRSGLERMYDATNIAKIQKEFGVEPKHGRLEKAFFMRTLFFELHSALDETRGDERKTPQVEHDFFEDEEEDFSLNYDYFDATKRLLIQECLRRMAFELVFMQSMIYMNRIQYVSRVLKNPTWIDLNSWDSL
jgi:hypothetical protein